jgi:hypothetical protein
MKYTEYDMGQRARGDQFRVDLEGNAANVLLLDSINRNAYRRGARYPYHGGHYTQSPAMLTVPSDGHWYVVVDLGGRAGHVRSSVQAM